MPTCGSRSGRTRGTLEWRSAGSPRTAPQRTTRRGGSTSATAAAMPLPTWRPAARRERARSRPCGPSTGRRS
eukprot:2203886-Lingulodinium_polyedra.AAC.1